MEKLKPFDRKDLIHSLEMLLKQMKYGCGNHGCVIRPPKGMGTNSICRCYPSYVSHDLRELSNLVLRIDLEDWKQSKKEKP
jgi:hypothetical protein